MRCECTNFSAALSRRGPTHKEQFPANRLTTMRRVFYNSAAPPRGHNWNSDTAGLTPLDGRTASIEHWRRGMIAVPYASLRKMSSLWKHATV